MLDEPTTHLDTAGIEELVGSLVSGSGPGILMVTHDPTVAASAERVLHLRDGRLTGAEPDPASPPELSVPGPGERG
jgi:ABC-type lipoprotein export system ATPase subunit